ncbi:MAG: right-handed parallel beta-helix repeat-containing protein, partial [Thermoplasmata archaeon]|nr:right-handed parallel beta-helix repeat-containing protein [Thermoplasmata archaeon]
GNYWSNWDGNGWGSASAYPIDGGAGAYDKYPFGSRKHSPIHINGNADFASQAASEGWPGNGSPGNPYIIEGYEIDGGGGSYCIWIENTSVYFVIRNCNAYKATNSGSTPNGAGIALKTVTNGRIENNKCNDSTCGIRLYGSSQYNEVIGNNASSNGAGIYLLSSSYNNISGTYASLNSYYGLYLYYSTNNAITGNNASGNADDGIYLESSSNNNITNNNVSFNTNYGIYLSSASNNNLTGNNATGNGAGIYMYSTTGSTLAGNVMWGNGIMIWGNEIHWNTHNIDTTNLVNGKPVYYYRNQVGGQVPDDAGQVILVNCTGMLVKNLSLMRASAGVLIGFSKYTTVTGNNASNNLWGICLYSSSYNNITGNNASFNTNYGLYLSSSSSGNNISGNNASGNYYGIFLDFFSSNNTITYNRFCNNTNYGAFISFGSTGNSICHNNFIGNNGATKGVNGNCQAYDDAGGNSWYDNGAREGNYWSNWDGNGWGSASAYPVDGGAGASDWYPLANPVSEFSQLSVIGMIAIILFALSTLIIRRRK